MTIPSTEQNTNTNTPVLLTSVVVGLAALAAGAFLIQSRLAGGNSVANSDNTTSIAASAQGRPAVPGAPPSANAATAAAKAQAAAAARASGAPPRRDIDLRTSFDGVPKNLGGEGKGSRIYPARPAPPVDNATKPAPIVQGKLPPARFDPFVSRLIIPLPREYAYTLAIPERLAPYPKPPVVIVKELDPDLRLGPLPYVQRRVAGFLEYGGVSALLETGGYGNGAMDIIQPGQRIQSGIAGVGQLTVESISSSEVVLRADDGRTVRVALSGVPGGLNIAPSGGSGIPGGPGGPPPGFGGPGGPPSGFGGRGGVSGVD